MTMHVPHATPNHRALPAFAAREALEELPSRRPPTASSASSALQWERVEVDRYEVRRGKRTLGFIDVVGAVFVVLAGSRYSRAIEFAQTLVFEDAVSALSGDEPTSDPSSLRHNDEPQGRPTSQREVTQ